MHHIFLVKEEGAEVDAAGRQHSFVGLEVHPVHNKGAVTQQALLALAVKLLQHLPTVPRELHRRDGSGTVEEAGRNTGTGSVESRQEQEAICGTWGKADNKNNNFIYILLF